MLELLAAIALAPWAHPLVFRPLAGWQTGASGTVKSAYVGHGQRVPVPKESAAWIAKNVRYRSPATEDPPNTTLRHLRRDSVIVWAVIFQRVQRDRTRIRLDLRPAKYFACCEGEYVAGGSYQMTGRGPCGAYSVIIRIYFGSPATRLLRAQAQRALNRLQLPPCR